MTMKNKYNLLLVFFIASCSIAPGMHLTTENTWLNNDKYVYISSLDRELKIIDINESLNSNYKDEHIYRIGVGDQIAVTIWGLPDIFPITNLSPDQNLRRVDSNGNIFFPYVGLIKSQNLTQNELRISLTNALSEYFNEPQVDVTISNFNSQQVFVLGEVTRPQKLNITDIPLSLSDAVGESFGLNTNTASSEVFVIRQYDKNGDPQIFYADLSTPSNFINAGQFYLLNNDIVYVNSSGTARWNKVISQFFPFSSFLNSVDNLTQN